MCAFSQRAMSRALTPARRARKAYVSGKPEIDLTDLGLGNADGDLHGVFRMQVKQPLAATHFLERIRMAFRNDTCERGVEQRSLEIALRRVQPGSAGFSRVVP